MTTENPFAEIDKAGICKTMADKGYLLKNIKTWDSEEGGGFHVTLYKGKQKIARFTNDGNGGGVYAPYYAVESQLLLNEFEAAVRALPQWFCYDKMIDMSDDIVITEMLNEIE